MQRETLQHSNEGCFVPIFPHISVANFIPQSSQKPHSLKLGQDISHSNNSILLSLNLNLIARKITKLHFIPNTNIHRHNLSITRHSTRSNLDDLPSARLAPLLTRCSNQQSPRCCLLIVVHLDQHIVTNHIDIIQCQLSIKLDENVIVADQGVSVSVVDDFGTVVLSVDDSVAGGDGHGKEDSGFLVCFTRASGDYSSFCLFDFGRSSQENTTSSLLLNLCNLNQHKVIRRCQYSIDLPSLELDTQWPCP
mmetsp:Transcript_10841/g.23858  ORF Transcript_10841/g.23858 Transcript_10841/m.23858 type:complete len:250 (+) Transcript_10841:713-1462(+)